VISLPHFLADSAFRRTFEVEACFFGTMVCRFPLISSSSFCSIFPVFFHIYLWKKYSFPFCLPRFQCWLDTFPLLWAPFVGPGCDQSCTIFNRNLRLPRRISLSPFWRFALQQLSVISLSLARGANLYAFSLSHRMILPPLPVQTHLPSEGPFLCLSLAGYGCIVSDLPAITYIVFLRSTFHHFP